MKFSFSTFWFWPFFLLLLAPFIYALGFCFPRGDDFDEATRAMFLFDLPGGLYEIGREWLNWSGRYTYHFLAVFLGKLPHLRNLAAIFGLGLFTLYFYASYAIGAASGLRPRHACLFGLVVLFVILCSWQSLPDFYLFTDMLTICLQGAASLCFFAYLARLWLADGEEKEKKSWQLALFAGIFAIGIYEHAALAVMDGLCVVLALTLWTGRSVKRLANLFLWLLAAFLFSFLAPGNFNRQSIRGKSESGFFDDWLSGISNFAGSDWIVPAILCGLLLAFLAVQCDAAAFSQQDMKKARGQQREIWLKLLFILPLAGLALAFGYAVLHSQSEYGLGVAPKFRASLSLYLSFTLAGSIFAAASLILRKFPGYVLRPISIVIVLLVGLIGICGQNYQLVSENAASGQIWLLGNFMETRLNFLRELAANVELNDRRPKFGLAGEWARPDARKPPLDPALPRAVVGEYAGSAFPVWIREDLRPEGDAWPNKWGAWFYGLFSIAAARPVFLPTPADQENAIGLAVPEELRKKGIVGAEKIVTNGPNPTFRTLWLVLEFSRKTRDPIRIIRPNPLTPWRLLPMPLQKSWLEKLLARKELREDWRTRLTSTKLYYKNGNWLSENRLAVPIFTGLGDEIFPEPLFLNFVDGKYYCLKPWL